MTVITQTMVDNLETALMSGVLSVDDGMGNSIEYRSTDDLMKALAYAKGQLAAAAGTANSQSYGSFSKD